MIAMTRTLRELLAGGEPAVLISLLARQLDCFTSLLQHAERQSQAIADADADALLRVLTDRKRLVNALTDLNARMEPFTRDWPACLACFDQASRERVGQLTRQIGEVRDAIASRDATDAQALTEARDKVQSQLAGVSVAGQAASAYRANAAGRPANARAGAGGTGGASGAGAAGGYRGIGVGPMPNEGRFTDQRG